MSEKFLAKYIRQLEKQLQQQRADLKTLRADLEFYRGKVERLEVSLMQNAPAMQTYATRTDARQPNLSEISKMIPGARPPWGDLKRRWGAMSEADQAKALEEGWKIEEQEVKDAGSS